MVKSTIGIHIFSSCIGICEFQRNYYDSRSTVCEVPGFEWELQSKLFNFESKPVPRHWDVYRMDDDYICTAIHLFDDEKRKYKVTMTSYTNFVYREQVLNPNAIFTFSRNPLYLK